MYKFAIVYCLSDRHVLFLTIQWFCNPFTLTSMQVCEPILPAQLFPTKEGTAADHQQQQLVQNAFEEHDSDSDEDMEGEEMHAGRGNSGHTGMNTLLHFDESTPMQHGAILIRPTMNIGVLLDPLDEEEQEEEGLHQQQDDTIAPKDLGHAPEKDGPLDWFLSVGCKHFSYTPVETELARRVYAAVDDASTAGITMLTLQTTCEGHHSLEKVVGNLVNLELVSERFKECSC